MEVQLVFPGVDFAALKTGGELESLLSELVEAWALAAGVSAERVSVSVSAGSLVMDVTIAFREGEGFEGAEARAATTQGAVSDLSLVADVVQQSPVLRAAIGVGDVVVTASDMQALVQVSRNEQAKYSEQEVGAPANDTMGSALSTGTLAGAAVAPLLLLVVILALIQRRRRAGQRRRESQAQTTFLQRGRGHSWQQFLAYDFPAAEGGDGVTSGSSGRKIALSVINPLHSGPKGGSPSLPPPIPEELRASLSCGGAQPPPIPGHLLGSVPSPVPTELSKERKLEDDFFS